MQKKEKRQAMRIIHICFMLVSVSPPSFLFYLLALRISGLSTAHYRVV